MLKEAFKIGKNIDINLPSTKHHYQPLLPLQRSCSGYELKSLEKISSADERKCLNLKTSPYKYNFRNSTSGNLSWTFLEQISSDDNSLRRDETDASFRASVINAPFAEAVTKCSALHNASDPNKIDLQPLTIGVKRGMSNSNDLTTKSKLAVDVIISQQTQKQQRKQQRHKRNNSIVIKSSGTLGNIHSVYAQNNDDNNFNKALYTNHESIVSINNNYKENNNDNFRIINKNENFNKDQEQSVVKKPKQHNSHQNSHHDQNHSLNSKKHSEATNGTPDDCNSNDALRTDAMMLGTSSDKEPNSGTSISTGRTTKLTGNQEARIRNLPAITEYSPAYGAASSTDVVDLVGDTTNSISIKAKGSKAKKEPHKHGRMVAAASGAAAKNSNLGSQSFVHDIETHMGLSGWRKKCLYTLLVLLMLLIVINLALTLWILKVMEFTTDGMGQLKIIPGGIQLSGQALILDVLRASTIRSRHGQPISIESSRNFSINTRDANGALENHLFLGHDKLECLATGFRINDTIGRNLFSVNRDEVTIGAHALRIDGEGGAVFRESVQTPHVRAEPGRELRLESPTRKLELTAAKDINLQSRAGGIELNALDDVKLNALDGSLRLESSKILMPNLRTVQPALPGTTQTHDHVHRVFQLCACANGKLFLAASHSICAGDDSTVCR